MLGNDCPVLEIPVYRSYQEYDGQEQPCSNFWLVEMHRLSAKDKAGNCVPLSQLKPAKILKTTLGAPRTASATLYTFWIWIDPCLKYTYAYIDYPPPQAWAPVGYDYTYVEITNPETGQTEIVPVNEEGYMTYEQAANLPGAKIVSTSSGKVSLPGSSWFDKLNLSDPQSLIGIGLLGFVGYEIFRSLKKR